MSKRIAVGVAALLLNFSPLTFADPVDDATQQIGVADTKSASASAKVTQVGKLVSTQQEVLIKLLRLIDDAQARHDRLMPLIDDSLKQADQGIVSAKQDLEQRDRASPRGGRRYRKRAQGVRIFGGSC